MAGIGDDPLRTLAHAAIAVLREAQGGDGDLSTTIPLADGRSMSIAYRGPSLPDDLPREVASAELVVERGPGWAGAHRLRIEAPLPVFDLLWNPDEPLRVLYFSRGDWEADLLAACGQTAPGVG